MRALRETMSRFGAPETADLRRAGLIALAATAATVLHPSLAMAQAINLDLGTGGGLTDRVVQLVGAADGAVPGAVHRDDDHLIREDRSWCLSLLRQALGSATERRPIRC